MKTFDIQAVEIKAPFEKTFDFIADPKNLLQWAHAFKEVREGRALMQTPNGSVEVELTINASREQGTVDWHMAFPDGKVAIAYSRVLDKGRDRSLYVFILMEPPVPLEQLEGTLERQSHVLREELSRLNAILSSH
jgi:hypothetical protein